MLVPYDSPDLIFANEASTGAAASPFVVALTESGINSLPGFINGCILLFVVSAANSDLYISSRTLYSLALEGNAPLIFARTNGRGVPIFSLTVSGIAGCIAFLNISNDSKVVFGYFVNLVTIFSILTWISLLVSHICFVRARRAQRLNDKSLPYTAPLRLYGSYGALTLCIIITLFKNFDVFIGPFQYSTFITGYLGIPIYLSLIAGYKILRNSKRHRSSEVDLRSGRVVLDTKQEEEVKSRSKRHGCAALRPFARLGRSHANL